MINKFVKKELKNILLNSLNKDFITKTITKKITDDLGFIRFGGSIYTRRLEGTKCLKIILHILSKLGINLDLPDLQSELDYKGTLYKLNLKNGIGVKFYYAVDVDRTTISFRPDTDDDDGDEEMFGLTKVCTKNIVNSNEISVQIVLYKPLLKREMYQYINHLHAILHFQDRFLNSIVETHSPTQHPRYKTLSNYPLTDVRRIMISNGKSQETIGTPRSPRTVYYKDIDEMKRLLTGYINQDSLYHKLGIKHTLSLFITGKTGSGKTTLVDVIANYLSCSTIIYLSFDDKYLENLSLLKTEYSRFGSSSSTPQIIVLDEIDKFLRVSEQELLDDKDLSAKYKTLLELLDGSLTPNGCIFLALGTGLLDLPSELTREGRIANIIKLNYFKSDDVKHLVDKLNKESDSNVNYKDVLSTCTETYSGEYVPAEVLQKYLRAEHIIQEEQFKKDNSTDDY